MGAALYGNFRNNPQGRVFCKKLIIIIIIIIIIIYKIY